MFCLTITEGRERRSRPLGRLRDTFDPMIHFYTRYKRMVHDTEVTLKRNPKTDGLPVREAKGESIAGEGGNTRFAFALGHLL